MSWRFPAVKFVKTNTVGQQIRHVVSEAIELLVAWVLFMIKLGSYSRVLEEAADLYHSVESLWRIFLREGVGIHSEFAKTKVKNSQRGYYDG